MIDLNKLLSIQKFAQRIAGVSLIAFVALIGYSAYKLYNINQQAAAAAKNLDQAKQDLQGANLELNRVANEIKAKQKEIAELNEQRAALADLYGKIAREEPAVTQKVTDAVIQARSINAKFLPRVYFQIGNEAQREKAGRIAALLQQQGYIVPRIENVESKGGKVPDKTALRYYPGQPDTDADVDMLTGLLTKAGVNVVRQPLVKADPARARPRHYELWFGLDY